MLKLTKQVCFVTLIKITPAVQAIVVDNDQYVDESFHVVE